MKKDDVIATCQNVLSIGDDYGDNACTFRCTLEAGHNGPHQDEFDIDGQSVLVIWYANEDARLIANSEHLPLAR